MRFRIKKVDGCPKWKRDPTLGSWCYARSCIDKHTNTDGLCKRHYIPVFGTQFILEQRVWMRWKVVYEGKSAADAEKRMLEITGPTVVSEWRLLPDRTLEQIG